MRPTAFIIATASALALCVYGQRGTGELRLHVTDTAGQEIEAAVSLVSDSNRIRENSKTDANGQYVATGLPFGPYRIEVNRKGFATESRLVQIDSAIPIDVHIALKLATVETRVVVTESATLIDPSQTGPVYSAGREVLNEQPFAPPGRDVMDVVASDPGWVLEADGVLHPREAEYDTQYVVNGIPLLDNRSPAFAPPFNGQEVQSMNVLTGDYPAEYGRKLGGVVEVTTQRAAKTGLHGTAVAQGGSFSTAGGVLSLQDQVKHTFVAADFDGAQTDRFLDPPVTQNFTNKEANVGASGIFEEDWTSDHLRTYMHRKRASFLVPNEFLQEAAGQRQDRADSETMGQVSYDHILSPRLLLNNSAMWRSLDASLWSNGLSTPILPSQRRGIREGYVNASLSAQHRGHELKAGADAIISSIHEYFAFTITDPSFFDSSVPTQFTFTGKHPDREQSVFIQDLAHSGPWTLSAGIRWDHYRLLTRGQGFSPRLGVSHYWRSQNLAFHASYDRALEFPATENLLLSSSPAAQHLTSSATGLPVPASHGNFYQAGFTKGIAGHVRVDANYFVRDIRNFFDDDLLLNTGVSFPIAFASAVIRGTEASFEVPQWRKFSGFISYTNQLGVAHLPVTGGLFLEPNSAALLHSTDRFPVSQDQRNTAHARLRWQAARNLWVASEAQYGSGLPIESDEAPSQLLSEYGAQILQQVNFARGRMRPQFSFDASAAVTVWTHGDRSARLQADVVNLTNRLNVINFAGLFSGTALGLPRSFGVRLETRF